MRHRGSRLQWASAETGAVGAAEAPLHFGLNERGLINVFAKDVGRLQAWEQRIWAAHSVAEDGGVSAELFQVQMMVNPADTTAPEHALPEMLGAFEATFRDVFGSEILRPHQSVDDLLRRSHRFARALRDRSIEAEATPRRTRGVTRKAERIPVRKMRERFAAGQGPLPEVLAVAYRAALTAGGGEAPWLDALRTRELAIRRTLVAEALRLSRSEQPRDRALAALVERFVRERPAPMTRDQALRQGREARRDAGRTHDR
ncbi:hypothetical protein [Brevundimonas fontaquae]|uniref:Uncharacterized protein n=1 Tax=Brevundimonas fontaquae TaxID=2813778 RepID=A0ABX7LU77_9CAUL|nr:hypothetical protein [Brevundimonas fontaquae]QSF55660.1 hypothetical protein JX001_07755 [Brevundimonas fontaquae]